MGAETIPERAPLKFPDLFPDKRQGMLWGCLGKIHVQEMPTKPGKGIWAWELVNGAMAMASSDPFTPFLLRCRSSVGNATASIAAAASLVPYPAGEKRASAIVSDAFLTMQKGILLARPRGSSASPAGRAEPNCPSA